MPGPLNRHEPPPCPPILLTLEYPLLRTAAAVEQAEADRAAQEAAAATKRAETQRRAAEAAAAQVRPGGLAGLHGPGTGRLVCTLSTAASKLAWQQRP